MEENKQNESPNIMDKEKENSDEEDGDRDFFKSLLKK